MCQCLGLDTSLSGASGTHHRLPSFHPLARPIFCDLKNHAAPLIHPTNYTLKSLKIATLPTGQTAARGYFLGIGARENM